MNRKKILLTLSSILVVCIVVTLCISNIETKKEEIKVYGETLFSFEYDDVKSVAWTYGATDIKFTREGDQWILQADKDFPVYDVAVADFLSDFENFNVSFRIDDVSDYSLYGLESPEAEITIETASETYTIQAGSFSTVDSKRYVRVSGEEVYLAASDPVECLNTNIDDFIKHDVLTDFSETWSEITVSGESDTVIVWDRADEKPYADMYTYYAKNGSSFKALDTGKTETLVKDLQNINLTSYMTYTASETDFEPYGLDDPYTVEIAYDAGEKCRILLGTDGEAYYLHREGSEFIYSIAKTKYDEFTQADYSSLRNEKLVMIDSEKVSKISVSLDGETYTLDDKLVNASGEAIDWSGITDDVFALSAEEFTGADGKGKQEIKLILTYGENNNTYSLTAFRLDGEYCLVTSDGISEYAKIPRTKIVNLIENINKIVL